jgi:hypothetical protein
MAEHAITMAKMCNMHNIEQDVGLEALKKIHYTDIHNYRNCRNTLVLAVFMQE